MTILMRLSLAILAVRPAEDHSSALDVYARAWNVTSGEYPSWALSSRRRLRINTLVQLRQIVASDDIDVAVRGLIVHVIARIDICAGAIRCADRALWGGHSVSIVHIPIREGDYSQSA